MVRKNNALADCGLGSIAAKLPTEGSVVRTDRRPARMGYALGPGLRTHIAGGLLGRCGRCSGSSRGAARRRALGGLYRTPR